MEALLTDRKEPAQGAGLENMSVSNSRCTGQKRNGICNPARQDGKTDSTESTRMPDQQIPPR
jgi:hypothetical protein